MEQGLHPLVAIGLKSDTAITGVDAALVKTDGVDIFENDISISRPYSEELRADIKSVLGEKGQLDVGHLKEVERKVTQHHIDTVQALLDMADKNPLNIDVIAFPGHTVLNRPSQKLSIQIGNADTMLQTFGRPVVNRFYQADLASGGQGAPIFPSFFDAMTRDMEKPLAVLSIGGLTSLSYIGVNGELAAFEVGPGNILIDQWMQTRMGAEMDFDGLWAAKGMVDQRLLRKLRAHPYFAKKPPKSADRDEFDPLMQDVDGSSVADGAATLTALTVQSIADAVSYLPENPKTWIVIGGGAFNPSIIKGLKQSLKGDVLTGEELHWNTSNIEAQGFAFLAVRTMFNLPISFPSTTGVPAPMPGGRIHQK